MTPKDETIQKLKNQLNEWSTRIDLLAAKQEEAAVAAKRLAQELDELRIKHRTCVYQLRELEKNEFNMWENIGDGG
ncbi:MAG: hypothetical protein ACU84H_15080 [Gammaproteobacteria bacterium]